MNLFEILSGAAFVVGVIALMPRWVMRRLMCWQRGHIPGAWIYDMTAGYRAPPRLMRHCVFCSNVEYRTAYSINALKEADLMNRITAARGHDIKSNQRIES